MRLLGIILLIGGFLWIGYDVAVDFPEHQYEEWMWQTQNLPAGETIQRTDAVSALRGLSLDLKNTYELVFIPAVLMLAGGLIAGFSKRRPSV